MTHLFIPSEVARRINEEFAVYGLNPQIFSFDETTGYQIHYKGSCYAMQYAHPDVKKAATAVIGANTEDGVARFLKVRFKLEECG